MLAGSNSSSCSDPQYSADVRWSLVVPSLKLSVYRVRILCRSGTAQAGFRLHLLTVGDKLYAREQLQVIVNKRALNGEPRIRSQI